MPNLIIISGTSGSGKSTALKAFEDLGYLAIDNFPTRLLVSFLKEVKESLSADKVALVMDIRDKYFLSEFKYVLTQIKSLGYFWELVFLDARTKVIISRFNLTRRLHPLLKEKELGLEEAIELEKKLLAEIRQLATLFIDTSNYNIHQLRNEIFNRYRKRTDFKNLVLHFISFGYKYGLPPEADYVFDARMLPNPYFDPELKPLTGENRLIKEYLLKSEVTQQFLDYLKNFLNWLIPVYSNSNKRYLSLAIGCTGGRHRSVALIDHLKDELKNFSSDVEIIVSHRDINKDE
ncbi:RNase adapter RapZ [Thermodesulfobacterium sp. TA1]|uniref:RNase adapter RapZ n=1 Tax=Thermodesulfobacterium sp. TA1 TaxID=2234087 RepID=UPI00123286FB|nr:RNase adapter RapZ [Thermodesulfobacterium sp. TA1]QER41967.1 RNase adapter RapZ [Thermodesulfobacterium sp. TA1]